MSAETKTYEDKMTGVINRSCKGACDDPRGPCEPRHPR